MISVFPPSRTGSDWSSSVQRPRRMRSGVSRAITRMKATSGQREASRRQREVHGRSGQVTLEGLGDLLFGDRADNLLGHLATLEDEQGGDPANVEPAGGVDVFVHV
jgi:hypothetical protein